MQKENSFINIFFMLLFFVVLFYLLSTGASLVIPFVVAVLFSLAIIGLSDFYKKIGYKNWKLPGFFCMILSIATYIFVFWVIWKMMNSNIQEFVSLLPVYEKRVSGLYMSALEYFRIPHTWDAYTLFQKINLTSLFTSVVTSITAIFSKAGLIFFYVFFILLEYRYFGEKLQKMFPDTKKRNLTIETLNQIKVDIKSYFVIKTMVSLLAWLGSYIIMLIVGLDFALFLAMLAFLLNFIPNIWSTIAVFFPVTLSLIQYDSLYPFAFLLTCLVWVQILTWNIIEPKIMGNKLNLSPLVILISLAFWGTLWWVAWMLLSVPLMVILNIALSKFPATRPIAVLLSEKWDLDVNDEENSTRSKQELVENVKKKIDMIKNLNK